MVKNVLFMLLQVLSTNIVMDLGESLNPAIDIGQVEGAFMQGYGLFMLEQIVHSPTGTLLTRGPGAYKIPSFNDIPGQYSNGNHVETKVERSFDFVFVFNIKPKWTCLFQNL